jgi:ribosomal protein S18 acetylase RimI-like enzyme
MIAIRRAAIGDAASIGAVHVAAWRSTYAGILPDSYLARLSPTRLAMHYKAAIAAGAPVMVAAAAGTGPKIVGFTTASGPLAGVSRPQRPAGLGGGEVETLYVLDDFRDQGIGRRLMRAAASQLVLQECRSAFVWVLRDNPNRWFYRRLGGQPAAEGQTHVAGVSLPQVAYCWDPIDRLLAATPAK